MTGFLCADCAECLGLVAVRVGEGGSLFYDGVKNSVWKDGAVVQLCVQYEYGIIG